jgi:hypothetical protein
MPDKKLLEKVARDRFTTYRFRDCTVMKDILLYRTIYAKVVKQLTLFFKNALEGKKDITEEPEDADDEIDVSLELQTVDRE